MAVRLVSISYQNVSGSDIPPHGVMQITGDAYVTPTGDIGFQVQTPGSGTGPYVIDNGKGATASGAGQYGQCYRAFEGAVWVAYADGVRPLPAAWGPVGPAAGSAFTMSGDGTGYYYAGSYDVTNTRILVTQSLTAGLRQGITTSALTTAVTNSWTGAATVNAIEYISNPADHSTPGKFISGTTGVAVVVREKITIPAGSYIQWIPITLADGRVENELTWVKAGASTIHQGVAASAITLASTDLWIRPSTITADEYIPDPAGSAGMSWPFIAGTTGLKIVVRDHLTVAIGDFVQWIETPLPDGSVERELTWVNALKPPGVHQGIVFAGATSLDNWIRPSIVEVTEYVNDPTDTTAPRSFISNTIVDVVVRDKITVPTGAYVQWQTITLADGTTENELTYIGNMNSTFHQGIVATGVSSLDNWIRPGVLIAIEYVADPTSGASPRGFAPTGTGVSVVVRDKITVAAGQYIQWQTISLPDGTSERQLTYAQQSSGLSMGVVTSGTDTFGTDPWLGPAVIAVTQFVDDPTATNAPRNFVYGFYGIAVVVRDNLVIRNGAIVQWKPVILTDGTVENQLTWVKPTTLHQGIATATYTKSRVWDRWTNAGTVLATEYVDDPSSTTTPRKFIVGPTSNSIVVRSQIASIPSGTYIHWEEFPLSDGTYENLLTGADCP